MSKTAPISRQTRNLGLETPSDVLLFLRNLRFLELDLLADWPNCTKDTFSARKELHISRTDRIRSAEWVLFKLFEIWDPKECKIKLRAYFPALEPIQSIKLRGAFCQWLSQLKAAGFLNPECMPRKSVFDECQGAKFEEVLLHFSTAVLNKVVYERKQTLPVAQALALKPVLSSNEDQQLEGLTYAHFASLESKMAQKAKHRARIDDEAKVIATHRGSLEDKRNELESNLASCELRFKQAGIDARIMKKQLRDDCTNDPEWLSVMISGDSTGGRDDFIEKPFCEVWASTIDKKISTQAEDIPYGLVSDLSQRVVVQQSRLDMWRSFQQQVSKRNEGFIVTRSPARSPVKSPKKPHAATPVRSPRKPAKDSPVPSNSIIRTRSIKNRETSNRPSPGAELDFEEHTSSHPSPPSKPDRSRAGLDGNSNPAQKSGLPNPKWNNTSISSHKRAQSDALASSLAKAQSFQPTQDIAEEMGNRVLAPSPQSLELLEKNVAKSTSTLSSQTLAERTLHTLQQCKTEEFKKSQAERYSHCHTGSLHINSQSNPISSGRADTPDQSRPGTSNTTSSFQGFPASSIESPSSFGTSWRSSSKPSSPSRVFQAPSPTRTSRTLVNESLAHVPTKEAGAAVTEDVLSNWRDEVHTPPETLFTEEADCASVFKTRNKLRFSPPTTPSVPPAETELQSPFDDSTR